MKKLLIICGGQSSEHIVSRMSTTSLLSVIDHSKYQVTVIGITEEGSWYQLDSKIQDITKETWLDNATKVIDVFGLLKSQEVAFPVLHGLYGEDGTIQGLFELAGLPYVGCRVLASSVSMDKIYTKKILDTVGIPQVPSMYVKRRYDNTLVVVSNSFEEYTDIENQIEKELGFPCFIKASNSGSSVGCYRVNQKEELLTSLQAAAKYDRKVVVEKCVDCIELETAVLGNDDPIVSRVGQIMPHGEFYTFESKYEDKESKTCIPANVDPSIQDKIREYALKVFKAVDGHGLSRVDFFLDKQSGEIYLNEINTLPGFTVISMYPQLIQDLGITYQELIDKLIELAYQR
ncbi:D-alanine--D-alanine ligase family protein [Tannockella kyphosi]|uniref:D-alanine--D-alanine ligase family protein n=1 Tax=Tannockella kyphosi TaxID=2899121 RepID=UPI00201308DA|nr:D-alanine--D-alanine ligase family protein [Tannockella kyphosi]